MANGGYKKALYNSRNMRPGDSTDKPAPKRIPSFGGRTAGKIPAMTSTTAPHKTDLNAFDSKHGFGFGRTGLTGES